MLGGRLRHENMASLNSCAQPNDNIEGRLQQPGTSCSFCWSNLGNDQTLVTSAELQTVAQGASMKRGTAAYKVVIVVGEHRELMGLSSHGAGLTIDSCVL